MYRGVKNRGIVLKSRFRTEMFCEVLFPLKNLSERQKANIFALAKHIQIFLFWSFFFCCWMHACVCFRGKGKVCACMCACVRERVGRCLKTCLISLCDSILGGLRGVPRTLSQGLPRDPRHRRTRGGGMHSHVAVGTAVACTTALVCCPAPFCSDIHLKCAQPTVHVY